MCSLLRSVRGVQFVKCDTLSDTVDGTIAMEERKKGGGLGRATICNPTQTSLVSSLLLSCSLRTERPEQAILTIARERLNIDIWKVASLRGMQPFVCDLDGKLDKPLKAPPLLFSGSAAFIFIKYLQKLKAIEDGQETDHWEQALTWLRGFRYCGSPYQPSPFSTACITGVQVGIKGDPKRSYILISCLTRSMRSHRACRLCSPIKKPGKKSGRTFGALIIDLRFLKRTSCTWVPKTEKYLIILLRKITDIKDKKAKIWSKRG